MAKAKVITKYGKFIVDFNDGADNPTLSVEGFEAEGFDERELNREVLKMAIKAIPHTRPVIHPKYGLIDEVTCRGDESIEEIMIYEKAAYERCSLKLEYPHKGDK